MTTDKAEAVLQRIEGSGYRWNLPIVGRRKGRILRDVVREHQPKRVLEVGTLVGYSAITMSMEMDEGSEIVTIEYDEDEAQEARENIAEAELRVSIEVIVGDALEIIPELEGVFDMVFLDAAKHQYLEYLMLAEGMLREGGVVVADNVGYMSRSMRGYLERVRNSGEYRSRFVRSNGDGLEISVKV